MYCIWYVKVLCLAHPSPAAFYLGYPKPTIPLKGLKLIFFYINVLCSIRKKKFKRNHIPQAYRFAAKIVKVYAKIRVCRLYIRPEVHKEPN